MGINIYFNDFEQDVLKPEELPGIVGGTENNDDNEILSNGVNEAEHTIKEF